METEEIKKLILTGIADAQVRVTGGDSKYHAEVISTTFNNLTQVQRHQAVYTTVQEHIQNGRLHALSIATLTPEEAQSR